MKNYYVILGIAPTATPAQIKQAYRQQAKQFHPDYFDEGEGPFLEVQEAYSVLSDPARRQAYDRAQRPSVPRPAAEPLVREDDFSLLRSFHTFRPSLDELVARLNRNFRRTRPKFEHLRGLNVEVVVTPEAARRGGTIRLRLPVERPCPVCGGRGGVDLYRCRRCGGEGTVEQEEGIDVRYPAGIANQHVATVALTGLGIDNFYLNVIFRVGGR